MEDTGNYANRPYMDGMDYRYIKTFPRDRIDAAQSLHLDFFGRFFFSKATPPAALPAKRPFLELLTAARLRNFGSAFSVLGRVPHLIFSSVMMGHEGST